MTSRCIATLAFVGFLLTADSASLRARSNHLESHGHSHRGGVVGGVVGGDKASETEQQRAANGLAEVITVLNTMLKAFVDQANEDKGNWESYSKWSQDLETEKRNFVQNQEALVMSQTATKNANMQAVAKLTEDLAQLASDIAETRRGIGELERMRHEEHTQFQVSLADVSQTIGAIVKATQILQGHYAANAASLAAVRSRVQMALMTYGSALKGNTAENSKLLSSLLQNPALLQQASKNPDYLSVDGGSSYGSYDSAAGGGGVMKMLSDLNAQLESQRQQMIATESDSQRQFESTKAAKEAEEANALRQQTEKTEHKATAEATIQQCTATIDQATHEIGEANGVIAVTLQDRELFQKEFNSRSVMRQSEQAATQAALDALQSVSAGAKSGVGEAASFLQESLVNAAGGKSAVVGTTRLTQTAKLRLSKALAAMVRVGKAVKSEDLVKMATKLRQDYMGASQQDFYDQSKFGPVLKLLGDLIGRLEAEAAAETSQHEWCETEKESSVKSKEEREKTIHALQGTIEGLTTNIAQLKSEVEFLEAEIVRVTEETRVAREIRASEKQVYTQARADHEEVIKAIVAALGALGGQYGSSLLQATLKTHRRQSQTPFSSYSSGSSGAGSAMEMLEDLQERYSAALREIITDEENSVKAFEDLMARNAQFLEDCRNTRNAKTSERRGLINDLGDDKASMKTNLLELHEVSKYLMDLRPSCDDIRSTFEERKQRREAEIAALKEALSVISDPSMA